MKAFVSDHLFHAVHGVSSFLRGVVAGTSQEEQGVVVVSGEGAQVPPGSPAEGSD